MNFRFSIFDFRLAARALLLPGLLLAAAACKRDAQNAGASSNRESKIESRKLVLPEHGAYTGAYIDWGEKEDAVGLEAIEQFDRMVGRHQAIVASSSYWGEGTFPEANVRVIAAHGSVPLIFWSPWDKPYEEGRGPDKFSITSIIEGKHDAYIDQWGDKARDFGQPMIVSFANEMNGSWFPWSGLHYGGSTVVEGTKPPNERFVGPETF